MPQEQRERFERLEELHGFLRQSNISGNNLKRLETLCDHAQPDVATLAALILDVARVLPGKRSRWLTLAQRYRPLFERAVGVLGLEYFQDLMVQRLLDLRDVSTREDRAADFIERYESFRGNHSAKPSLIARLARAGL